MKNRETKLVKTENQALPESTNLYERVREILNEAKRNVARSVNTEMVRAYWLIGKTIIEHEQSGRERADYGKQLIELLSQRLKAEMLRGFDRSNLWHMRNFYLKFPNLHALRAELSWTHYCLLLRVESDGAREFYETEAIPGKRLLD
jgi:hypothetical protein